MAQATPQVKPTRKVDRKDHLRHTVTGGPACNPRSAAQNLHGRDVFVVPYDKFVRTNGNYRCEKCANGKLFSTLARMASKYPAHTQGGAA